MSASKKNLLHNRIENVLKNRASLINNAYSKSLEELVEDLKIYQYELEFQNEELARTQLESEISKEAYRNLFQHAPVAYVVLDEDLRIIECNETFHQLLENVERYIPGKDFRRFVEAGSQNQFHFFWRALLQNLKTVPIEIRLIKSNGIPIDVQVNGLASKPNIKPQIRLSFINISLQKQALQTLQAKEELLSEMGRVARVGGWNLDLATMKVSWTEETFHIHEIATSVEPDLDGVISFYAPEARAVLKEAIGSAIRYGTPFDLELPFITAKGNHLWVRSIGKVQQADNKTKRIYGVFQDITDRKKTENLVKARLDLMQFSATHSLGELLQEMLDKVGEFTNSPIGFYHFVESDQQKPSLHTWSNRTIKEFCNAKGVAFQYPLSAIGIRAKSDRLKQPVIRNDFVPTDNKKRIPEGYVAITRDLVVPILREDRVVAMLGVANKNDHYNDEDIRHVSYFADIAWEIAERKRDEEKILELNKSLEQRVAHRTRDLMVLNEALSFHLKEIEQFSFIASHDLQEPLRTLITYTSLLKEEYAGRLDETGNRSIEFISNSAERMRALVKGLLDYSLLGKESQLTQVDCNAIVSEVLTDLSGAISNCDAEILVSELPVLPGFKIELRLLFQNLINNALKYQHRGNQPVISIKAERVNNDFIFTIEDNGIGIEEKDREKIFIIFKRMHNRNQYEGTGIGLAHCKKIIELHHGKIWVDAGSNGGSAFKFSLPVSSDFEMSA